MFRYMGIVVQYGIIAAIKKYTLIYGLGVMSGYALKYYADREVIERYKLGEVSRLEAQVRDELFANSRKSSNLEQKIFGPIVETSNVSLQYKIPLDITR
jgi:hypothetical protein